MNFEIPVDVFVRLAKVTRRMPSNITEFEINSLKCVRLEYRKGNYYALASNRKIASIYYLGKTDQADAVAHVVTDEALVKQCESEMPYGSKLSVVSVPALQTVSLKTTFGYNFPGNGGIFVAGTPLDRWSDWPEKEPITATRGAMTWHLEDMETINATCPSGDMSFPEFIDVYKPVVLRDRNDDNWTGLFMANVMDGETDKVLEIKPAKIPEWWTE